MTSRSSVSERDFNILKKLKEDIQEFTEVEPKSMNLMLSSSRENQLYYGI